MNWNFLFFMNSALLGVGLAMDAFSVSLANGMNEKKMKKSRMAYICLLYTSPSPRDLSTSRMPSSA